MIRALQIIWNLFWNLVKLAVFSGMLAATNTSFETIVVSGLGLIYVTVVTYSTIIVRMQMAQSRTSVHHFIRMAKIVGDEHTRQEMTDLEEDTEEQWSEFEKKNVIFYINMAFLFIIWAIAVVAIVSTL